MTYGQYIEEVSTLLSTLYTQSEAKHLIGRLFLKHTDKALHHFLYVQEQDSISPELVETIDTDVERLLHNEPIQYIEGVVHFRGVDLMVDSAVLIPRPETEELVSIIQSDYKSKPRTILDIGAGSGCISLALKKYWPETQVTALDVSASALNLLSQNASRNNLEVELIEQDILVSAPEGKLWDIIVSNPPYIASSERADMEENVLNYEPHLALFVKGADASIFYKRIIDIAMNTLSTEGVVYFETNPLTMEEVVKYAEHAGFVPRAMKDSFGEDRFLSLRKAQASGS